MFLKDREKPVQPKQKENFEKNNDISVRMATTLKRTLRHTKSIVDGKLYDTEKSTMISVTNDDRLLFITEKGNFFSCTIVYDDCISSNKDGICQVHEIFYSDIKPESTEYAKENIGRYKPEKYIELFGEVEEA